MPHNEENDRVSLEQGNDHLDLKNKNYRKKTFSSVSDLTELRNKYLNNPIIGYLNINSLRNKIIDLQEIRSKAPLDIVCIDETKFDESVSDFQFHMENYQFPPFRRDRNSKGGGKLVFLKNGLIAERVKDLETKVSETICIELTISKKKRCILFVYTPPKQKNVLFFQEISNSLNQLVNKYENVFLADALNIDLLDSKSDPNNHFSVLRGIYHLKNLVKVLTCYKNLKGTLSDVLLTNRPNSFQKNNSLRDWIE